MKVKTRTDSEMPSVLQYQGRQKPKKVIKAFFPKIQFVLDMKIATGATQHSKKTLHFAPRFVLKLDSIFRLRTGTAFLMEVQ